MDKAQKHVKDNKLYKIELCNNSIVYKHACADHSKLISSSREIKPCTLIEICPDINHVKTDKLFEKQYGNITYLNMEIKTFAC